METAESISIKYIVLLTGSLLCEYYILFLSSLNIPEFIPFTPINLNGFVLMIIFISILIFFLTELIKIKQHLSVTYLTLYGAAICFLSEILFQGYQWHLFPEDGLLTYLKRVIILTVYLAIVSFFIAFQLKTKRTGRLISFIVAFMLLLKLITYISPTFFKAT